MYNLCEIEKTKQEKINYCNNLLKSLNVNLTISMLITIIPFIVILFFSYTDIGLSIYLILSIINCIIFKFDKKQRNLIKNIITTIEEQLTPYKDAFSEEAETINNDPKTHELAAKILYSNNSNVGHFEQNSYNPTEKKKPQEDFSAPISLTVAAIIANTSKHNLYNLMKFYDKSWRKITDQTFIFDRNNEYFSKFYDKAIEEAIKQNKNSTKDKKSE